MEEKENAFDSIRVSSASLSDQIDDREWQLEKHDEERILI
jgi:hypothetical protein